MDKVKDIKIKINLEISNIDEVIEKINLLKETFEKISDNRKYLINEQI